MLLLVTSICARVPHTWRQCIVCITHQHRISKMQSLTLKKQAVCCMTYIHQLHSHLQHLLLMLLDGKCLCNDWRAKLTQGAVQCDAFYKRTQDLYRVRSSALQQSNAASQCTFVVECISGQAGLLEDGARISVWQTDELLKLNQARNVAQVGVVQTGHFVFQQKRKVDLVQRAQSLDGKTRFQLPGQSACRRIAGQGMQVPLRLTAFASWSARVP